MLITISPTNHLLTTHAGTLVFLRLSLDTEGRLQGNAKHLIHFDNTKDIDLKINRSKKKVHQKIVVTLNFIREILLKFIRNKKNYT